MKRTIRGRVASARSRVTVGGPLARADCGTVGAPEPRPETRRRPPREDKIKGRFTFIFFARVVGAQLATSLRRGPPCASTPALFLRWPRRRLIGRRIKAPPAKVTGDAKTRQSPKAGLPVFSALILKSFGKSRGAYYTERERVGVA